VAGTLTADDPVEATVHDLGRRLHGPRRIRRSMLAEVEAGLQDTVDAQIAAGSAPDEARRRAVAEFGVPAELAPLYQAGIGVTQGRRTALLLALAFPGLLLGWDLLWALDGAGDGGAAPSPAVRLLSRVMDGTSLTVGVAAALLAWLLTRHGRAGRNTRGVARAAAWLGTAGAGVCAGVAVAMNVLGDDPASAALGGPHAAVPAYVVSAAVLVQVVRSVIATLAATR
jgi:hypothetical protein